MSPLALRGRVVVASVLVLAVGVGAIGLGLNVLLTRALSGDADAVLRARADAQQATIDVARDRVVVREGTQDEALDRDAWVFAAGAVVARPPASAALHREAASLSRVTVKTIRNVPGEVRLLAEPAYASDGRSRIASIVVGVSLAPYERTERLARGGIIIFALFVLLAGAIIAWRAVGAAQRPVAETARAAEDYSEHEMLARRSSSGARPAGQMSRWRSRTTVRHRRARRGRDLRPRRADLGRLGGRPGARAVAPARPIDRRRSARGLVRSGSAAHRRAAYRRLRLCW